jgi:two-component system nitrate/nitrite response regulator NarL
MHKTKVIIVDDHSITLSGIKNIVEGIDFVEVVGTANSGKEALEILTNNNIDIIITDVEMNDINGIELTGIVKEKSPDIKIIAVTQHSEKWIISKLLNNNVDSIILKSKTDKEEILLAMNKIKSGEKYYSTEVKDSFFNEKNSDNNIPYLTKREKEILTLICQEQTIKEIGLYLNIAASTVESHRKNLSVKLKVKSQSGLVREAIRNGFYTFD